MRKLSFIAPTVIVSLFAAPALAGNLDHPFADAPASAVGNFTASAGSSIAVVANVMSWSGVIIDNAITDEAVTVIPPERDRKAQT